MIRTYFNVKTKKFETQNTKTRSMQKVEITVESIESGKINDFEDDAGVKGFSTKIANQKFDVICLETRVINPESKYEVYYPAYSFDAEVCYI